ncbi:MAG: YceI family protein [Bacteroidota bacterium]
MKKITLLIFVLTTIILTSNAQQYITKSGNITFYSDGPLEKIEARNNQVNSALNTKTGDFVFKVLMKSFVFEKALMQEHFNENYVESDKFPVATFKGKVTNISSAEFSEQGKYNAIIKGELTIHGIKKQVEATGSFEVAKNSIVGESKFHIVLSDYDISIPGAVTGKIAEEIEISVNINLKPLKK